MRLADVEDFRRRAGTHELVHHLAAVELRVFDLAVQLAVREQAGAALAELHVGFGCQRVLAPQCPGVFGATSDIASPFQDDGLEAHLREQECREQPARPEPHHQRTLFQLRGCLGNGVITRVGSDTDLPIPREALQHRGFVAHRHVDYADEQNGAVFLARVVAALEQGEIDEVGCARGQGASEWPRAAFQGVVERQRQLGNADHRRLPGR